MDIQLIANLQPLITIFLFLLRTSFFPRVQGLLHEVFDLTVGAPEFFGSPALNLLQHVGVNA